MSNWFNFVIRTDSYQYVFIVHMKYVFKYFNDNFRVVFLYRLNTSFKSIQIIIIKVFIKWSDVEWVSSLPLLPFVELVDERNPDMQCHSTQSSFWNDVFLLFFFCFLFELTVTVDEIFSVPSHYTELGFSSVFFLFCSFCMALFVPRVFREIKTKWTSREPKSPSRYRKKPDDKGR